MHFFDEHHAYHKHLITMNSFPFVPSTSSTSPNSCSPSLLFMSSFSLLTQLWWMFSIVPQLQIQMHIAELVPTITTRINKWPCTTSQSNPYDLVFPGWPWWCRLHHNLLSTTKPLPQRLPLPSHQCLPLRLHCRAVSPLLLPVHLICQNATHKLPPQPALIDVHVIGSAGGRVG